MELPAYEIAGLQLSYEQHTKNEFAKIKKKWPNVTLDQAILIFENAPKDISLNEFACQKQRTVQGYRNIFGKYFNMSK